MRTDRLLVSTRRHLHRFAKSVVFKRRLGGDPDLVEDAVDVGLMEAWGAHRDGVADADAFVAYARDRVRRAVRAADQTARRRDEREVLEPNEALPDREAVGGCPERVLIAKRAVAVLEETERDVLFAWVEGESAREIGETYGRSELWAWRVVQRARARIRAVEAASERLAGLELARRPADKKGRGAG